MNSATRLKWMFAGLFAAGFLTGAAITAGIAWHYLPPPGIPTGSQVVEHLKREMRSSLNLTPQQEADILPALSRHGAELDQIREEMLRKLYDSITEKNAAVASVLNPAQRENFDRIEGERLRAIRGDVQARH